MCPKPTRTTRNGIMRFLFVRLRFSARRSSRCFYCRLIRIALASSRWRAHRCGCNPLAVDANDADAKHGSGRVKRSDRWCTDKHIVYTAQTLALIYCSIRTYGFALARVRLTSDDRGIVSRQRRPRADTGARHWASCYAEEDAMQRTCRSHEYEKGRT